VPTFADRDSGQQMAGDCVDGIHFLAVPARYDSKGNLYGTTEFGGMSRQEVVFKIIR